MFNVGTGKGLSVLEALNAFEEANDLKLNYSIGPRREGDVEKIFSDNKKVQDILKWKPNISIKSAMEHAWNWQLKNF